MTPQNFVTLPREVVEQWALLLEKGDLLSEVKVLGELRTALTEQAICNTCDGRGCPVCHPVPEPEQVPPANPCKLTECHKKHALVNGGWEGKVDPKPIAMRAWAMADEMVNFSQAIQAERAVNEQSRRY